MNIYFIPLVVHLDDGVTLDQDLLFDDDNINDNPTSKVMAGKNIVVVEGFTQITHNSQHVWHIAHFKLFEKANMIKMINVDILKFVEGVMSG